MPFVFDSSHQQGRIELDRSGQEQFPIIKKARFHLVHDQRLDLPVEAAFATDVRSLADFASKVAISANQLEINEKDQK